MELKSYFGALIVLSLNVREYCSHRTYDCDHPGIRLGDDLEVYNVVPGFKHSKVGVIFDVMFNRTLFVTVVISRDMVTDSTVNATNVFGCAIDYAKPYPLPFSENPGLIVPLRLGGSCSTINTYSMNEACTWSMEKFERWTVNAIQKYGAVKYCVKLSYPDLVSDESDSSEEMPENDDVRTPHTIMLNTFTHPDNKYINEMKMNNSLNSLDCEYVNTDDD